MADKIRLTKWLVKNRATMNPKFTQFSWPSRYFRGLFDYETRIVVANTFGAGRIVEASGRGIDFDEELAVEKATAECVERFLCLGLGIASEGVAVSGSNNSDEHAKNEALERYYFFAHKMQRRPFIKHESTEAKHLVENFESRNARAKLRFYQMETSDRLSGIVCAIGSQIDDPKFLGMALGHDIKAALISSMCEAIANFARFSDSPKQYLNEVARNEDLWICNPAFLKEVRPLFMPHNADICTAPTQPIIEPELLRESIDISKFEVLRGCPIAPVRYRVRGAQPRVIQ